MLWQERCQGIRTDIITTFFMLTCYWATFSPLKCFMVKLLYLHNYCHITSQSILCVPLPNQSKIWYLYKNITHDHIDFTFIIASGQRDMIKLPSVISPSLPASFIHNCKYFISHSSIVYQQFYFSLTGRQKKISNRASQNKASNYHRQLWELLSFTSVQNHKQLPRLIGLSHRHLQERQKYSCFLGKFQSWKYVVSMERGLQWEEKLGGSISHLSHCWTQVRWHDWHKCHQKPRWTKSVLDFTYQ